MEKQELIDRYVRGRMTSDERLAFESAMEEDEVLRMEVEQTENAMRLLRTAAAQKVAAATLARLYKEKPLRPQKGKVFSFVFFSGIAASIALLVYLAASPVNLPEIEDDLLVVRSYENTEAAHDTSVYHVLLKGYRDLDEHNYIGAIQRFEAVLESNDLRAYYKEATQWHLILAYLKSNQSGKAVPILQELALLDQYEYPIALRERWKLRLRVWMNRF